jgi:hypothetical protein
MDCETLRTIFPQGVWCLDTEFIPGLPYVPVCLVAREFFSGQRVQIFFEPGQTYDNPLPKEALHVAYAASAEWGTFLSLGWELPAYVIDLYAEYRNEISGRTPPRGRKGFDTRMLGAMDYYGLDHIAAAEKTEMRDLILRGHPFSDSERKAILAYCESDVTCLGKLLPAIANTIDANDKGIPGLAGLRGRYTKAVARMERIGIPIDRDAYTRLLTYREELKTRLVQDYEREFGPSPYLPDKRGNYKFNFRTFHSLLSSLGLLAVWETTPKARLKTREDYLAFMAGKYQALRPLAILAKRLGDLRKFDLHVGPDSRSYFSVMQFGSETGRNQPKAKQFLFAQSSWTRGLVKPGPDEFIAYIDWSAAEFAIAAALSGDKEMLKAYASGDPYIQSAISMGFAPKGATKATHGAVRDLFKVWLLSAQYGALPSTLLNRLSVELAAGMSDPAYSADDFLQQHRRVYARYWQWAQRHVDSFLITGCAETCYGWRHHLNPELKQWKIRNEALNFPIQAAGAEMIRWACVYATEAGIQICAPVHDALLICGHADRVEVIVNTARVCMDQASEEILGLRVRTDVKIVKYPDRFEDARGVGTWERIMSMLPKPSPGRSARPGQPRQLADQVEVVGNHPSEPFTIQ